MEPAMSVTIPCGTTNCVGEGEPGGTVKQRLASALRAAIPCLEANGCTAAAAEWTEVANELDPQ